MDILHRTGHAHSLLCHAHEWVRMASVQLIGLMLSTVTAADLARCVSGPQEEDAQETPGVSHLYSYEPAAVLKSITLDLLDQLSPGNQLNDKFILQVPLLI